MYVISPNIKSLETYFPGVVFGNLLTLEFNCLKPEVIVSFKAKGDGSGEPPGGFELLMTTEVLLQLLCVY